MVKRGMSDLSLSVGEYLLTTRPNSNCCELILGYVVRDEKSPV